MIVIPAGNSPQQFPAALFGSTFLGKQKAWKKYICHFKEHEFNGFIWASA
jgi:hypothetical protein